MRARIDKEFGQLIKALREDNQLTQERLAEMADLHRTYISQIERGIKSPTIVTLFKLSKALAKPPHMMIEVLNKRMDTKKR